MLLTRQHLKPSAVGLNMAAMIDVVFLLLIFFMCTMSFVPPEKKLNAQIPRVSSSADTPRDFEPIRVGVRGGEQGYKIYCDGQLCSTFAELSGKLRARRAIADIPVIIEGQNEVAFEYMVKALDSCYEAGLSQVAFSANEAAQ